MAEDGQTKPDTNRTQGGVIGQRFVQVVAEIPTVGEVEAGDLDSFAFRAQSFEEHNQVQLEEDHGINRGPPTASVHVSDEVTHEREVEGTVEMSVEVVRGHGSFERGQYRSVKVSRLWWAAQSMPPFVMNEEAMLLPTSNDFQQAGGLSETVRARFIGHGFMNWTNSAVVTETIPSESPRLRRGMGACASVVCGRTLRLRASLHS